MKSVGLSEKENEAVSEVRENIQENRVIRLTRRETEVLNLVLEGKSSKEVAESLFCSKRTVDFHLARIYDKLQVSNRVQAMRRAVMLGLLDVGISKKQ